MPRTTTGFHADLDDLLTWPILSGLGINVLNSITKAHVYNNGDKAVIVDRDDVVFNILKNKETGRMEMKQNAVLTGQKIGSFSSRNHCFALSEGGVLYGWGNNSYGQLGNTDVDEIPPDAPIVVKEMEDHKISRVVCGEYHTLALTEDGQVWVWGRSNYLQCTGTTQSVSVVSEVLDLPGCYDICISDYTSAALTKNGDLYTWGYNGEGLIGNQSTTHASTPYKVKILRRLVKFAMGYRHMLALTDDGRILGWGQNDNGQVGNNQKGSNATVPVMLECKEKDVAVKFFDIAALGHTSAAMSREGEVYIWGHCGMEENKSNQPIPLKTELRNLNEALARHSGIGTCKTLTFHNDDFKRDLTLAFDNELLSDCRFVLEGKTIHSQKAVLKNRSQYFQAMFNAEWKEANGEIKINNHTYTAYKALLKFLYTGMLDIPDEDLIPLLQLAHETMHEKLVSLCSEKLSYKISVDTVLEYWDVARKLDAEPLVTCCRQFGEIYMKDIVKADKEHSDLLTKFLVFVLTDDDNDSVGAVGSTTIVK